MKNLFIILCLLTTLGTLSCNPVKNGTSIDVDNIPRVQFNIVRIGNHQYIVSDPGYPSGLMCHYEDCDNPEHKPIHRANSFGYVQPGVDSTLSLTLLLNQNWRLAH